MTGSGQSDRRRLQGSGEVQAWECASHDIEAAPGYVIFVSGTFDGRRQSIVVDPDEVDELAKRLHAAKRYARSNR